VHFRQSTLTLAALIAALGAFGTGCGALFNGPVQTVEIKSTDPQAEIITNGTVIGKGSAQVTGSPTDPPVVYVRGKDGAVARVDLEGSVGAGWVVLDVLAGLTIIGLAAPICDAAFNGWSSLDEPDVVKLSPARPRPPRNIAYGTASAEDPARYAR
jgi:hypothetical protein